MFTVLQWIASNETTIIIQQKKEYQYNSNFVSELIYIYRLNLYKENIHMQNKIQIYVKDV